MSSVDGHVGKRLTLDVDTRADRDGGLFLIDFGGCEDVDGSSSDLPIADEPGGRQGLDGASDFGRAGALRAAAIATALRTTAVTAALRTTAVTAAL